MKQNSKTIVQAGLLALAMITLTSINIQAQKKIPNMKGPITMLVTFNIKSEQLELFKTALIEDAQNARNENGNVTMELYQHKDKPTTLYLFERWINQKVLDEHFEKPYTKRILELNKIALASPMEILYLSDIAPLLKNEFKHPLSTDNPVDLVVLFKIKEGMQKKFVQQFHKSIQNSRPEIGNIAFHFHEVQGDSTKFVLYERWRNQEALNSHFEQPYTKELFELFKIALDKPVAESLNFIIEIGHIKRSDN